MQTEKQSVSSNGGARPGAGRPPGVPNRATAERQKRVAASGVTPLDAMLELMREAYAETKIIAKSLSNCKSAEGKAQLQAALRAARSEAVDYAARAAPYVHPKLQSVLLSNTPGEALTREVIHTLDQASLEKIKALIA